VIATPGPPNVETITVDPGPIAAAIPAINQAFISITVCPPGMTTGCQTIDHIQVDTGSTGLRLISSVLTVALPAETSAGIPLAECFQFVDGTVWGSLAVADIKFPVSGEAAASVNVQIIADTNSPYSGHTPGDCTGAPESNVGLLGANGILGIGPFIADCTSSGACPIPSGPQSIIYYTCATPSTCLDSPASVAEQVPNPVTFFPDNNGVIVELPAVGASGTTTVTGSLVFGIGTQTNNALPTAAKVLPEDGATGYITATYKGVAYANSYLDSGSNGIFLTDASLTQCTSPSPNLGFYCQNPSVAESATLQGLSATTATANFTIGDADTIPANYAAFPGLGGTNPDAQGFDLGLPFFYGRNVFTAIEMHNAPGGTPPYFAY